VRADSPFRTLADLLAAAKDPASPVSYGTFGIGSTFHIYGETLRRAANVHMVMVPYKGEALALTDLLGGQIQATWASLGLISPHVAAGRVRALAIARPARSKVIPDVPTFSELGFPQVGTVTWFGVLLPAAAPRPIVQKMSTDINRVLAQPEVANSLTQTGIEPAGTTPERFAEVLKVDSIKWRQMIQEAGITASD
jgi:tripartite-type tricarboxylate transporter receptor subunit TctC